jgi:ribosomal protein S18 acetylase RimI-like enzyme
MQRCIRIVNLYPKEKSDIINFCNLNIVINDINNEILNKIITLKEKCFTKSKFNYYPNIAIIVFDSEKLDNILGCCGIDFTTGLHIHALCVDNNHRLKGIGKDILNKAFELSRIIATSNLWDSLVSFDSIISRTYPGKHIILEINNIDLAKFYKKCGFKKIMTINGYLSTTYCFKFI